MQRERMIKTTATKYSIITATTIAILACGTARAQIHTSVPRLVVNITIDQLRSDLLSDYKRFYKENGFKEIIRNGIVFTDARLNFASADLASSISSINTGTSPRYNGIIAEKWFDRNNMKIVSCVEDNNFDGISTLERNSAENVQTTTISDELKIANKKSVVISIAEDPVSAIIPAGHNADGAYWIDTKERKWCTTSYYQKEDRRLETYNSSNRIKTGDVKSNTNVTDFAIHCLNEYSLGADNTPDMLFVTYKANRPESKSTDKQFIYTDLDNNIGRLINTISSKVGLSNVLFVINSTGYYNEARTAEEKKLRIPGGTFYINRASNLLNLYLGALYGNDKYIEGYSRDQIYFNNKLFDKKRLNTNQICELSKIFIRQCQGVGNCLSANDILSFYTSESETVRNSYNLRNSGDLLVEVLPGWNIANEDNGETYIQGANCQNFPIIFYGFGLKGEVVTTPVCADRIAPTISKTIRIRAPNASKGGPLF